jgi:hypothetical protein
MSRPRYVIFAPYYRPTNGGAIVMHKLCHTLNELGENAVICPLRGLHWGGLRKRIREYFFPPHFTTDPALNTPVVNMRRAAAGDIVIYPEMTGNNPLRARNAVYWLLDRPSYRDRKVTPDKRDMFVIYDHRCDEPALTGGTAQTLFLFALNTTYKKTNHAPRNGSCYMMRKGKGQPIVHPVEDSIKIDGMTHDEINQIFNEREIFYSYDEMSSYSQYAAICGCTSVVIPWHFKDQAEFVAEYPLSRYGVAYGEENIPHAIATQHLVEGYLRQCEEDGVQSVRDFVASSRRHFGFDQAS